MNPSRFTYSPINSDPGTYVLVMRNDKTAPVQIGRWGEFTVQPGYYLYVGSAFGPSGLLARVSRHCRQEKSKRWHIDYLREFASIKSVWYSNGPTRYEHHWALVLARMASLTPIKGFGCSDCKCESHLFYSAKAPSLAEFRNVAEGKIEPWSCKSAV